MRKRYWGLAQALDYATIPDDVNEYILQGKIIFVQSAINRTTKYMIHTPYNL
ncbi:hypothetical protein C0J52_19541 [Blattella germanica]|nr:hypothetical protein C0J52_19541 [Blattella germanica]